MTDHYLVHANVAHARAPLGSSAMLGFDSQVEEVTALAHDAPGFIAEPRPPDEGAIYQSPLLLNLSIWSSVEDLDVFVHNGKHAAALEGRKQWFVQDQRPNYVLFWMAKGQLPTEREIEQRLAYLREHGATQYAFTFDQPFPSPEELGS